MQEVPIVLGMWRCDFGSLATLSRTHPCLPSSAARARFADGARSASALAGAVPRCTPVLIATHPRLLPAANDWNRCRGRRADSCAVGLPGLRNTAVSRARTPVFPGADLGV